MNYQIRQESTRSIAGFHLVGPWQETVPGGVERLGKWVKEKGIAAGPWVAVYEGNPDEVPAEQLRCDTAIAVPDDFVIPQGSDGVTLRELVGGPYAVATVRIENGDFTTPWYQFFDSLLRDSACQMSMHPCFEVYLNNGDVDGYWDLEMYISLLPQ
ncbi:DNA gyrase inhibitor SbmC [Pluralibacter gergoviae]|uniref:DNA gyrase inhibitor SbmC n=1 Tax=Pluralibacter gergoviae TaxID=61647 RepID=UPI002912B1B6|nr:DNA gyrase inhibitor SbmC [Pluralibacter gergoviae]MDU4001371.1 DNA gyrase inhibitor SbmC [Pluralibacter gergoviae]